MDSGDSSGEDVFECGRCKERFVNYDLFKTHKKNRVCKSADRVNSNVADQSMDLGPAGGLVGNLNNSTNVSCIDVAQNNSNEELNIGINSNIVALASELAFMSDIVNDSRRSAANQSQLIDHDYMFFQSPVDGMNIDQTRSNDTCMLCSAYTSNLQDHLERQHMIAKEKVLELVSYYNGESSLSAAKKPSKPAKHTCTQCQTVCKTATDLKKHVCQKLECAKCTSVFKDATQLKNHTCSKTCEHCGCPFTNALFMKHVCSKPEAAYCKRCNVQFLNSAHMQNHNCSSNPLVDSNKCTLRTRRCSLCRFSSINSSQLLSHFREQHMSDSNLDDESTSNWNSDVDDEEPKKQVNKEKVKCRRCKRTLLSSNLEKHKLICQDGKGKTCILCSHYSRDAHDYTIHVDTHRIWLDLDDIKQAKDKEQLNVSVENQSLFEGDKQNKKVANIDCSMLHLEDVDKQVKKVNKEQGLLSSQEATEENTQTGNYSAECVGMENKEKILQESCRNVNTRKCKSCGKFMLIDSLHNHMLVTHNKIKLFRCFLDTCMQVFSRLEQFNSHVKSHPENEDMLWCGCKTCVQVQPSGFVKRKELRKEKMRQYYHNMMYKCETCWSKFPTEVGLNKHKSSESHHYPCHICGKIQVSVRQLKMHILTHDTARHHLCDICGLGYKTSRDMKKHRLNHIDVRPFVCDSCGKAFPTKLKLNRHNLCVHNPVKAFACTHNGCEKKFSRKDKLKDHLNTHLAVEPYKCPYCSKGFYRSDNLRDHEVLHTRNYRFKCNMCSKGYMRPKLLEVHKQREHSDQQDDKQNKQQDANAFPLYTLYSQQPIQILPDAIQSLTAQTVQQLQQVVNEQQAAIDVQYHQQALVNTAVSHLTVFDAL